MIKLLPGLMQKVKDGEKSSTIRRGIKDYKLGFNILVSNNPKVKIDNVPIIITRLEIIDVQRISSEIANLEGYKSVKELISRLEDIYGTLSPDEPLTFVEFEVIRCAIGRNKSSLG